MQGTAHFHYKISHSLFREANGFFDHAAPLDAAVDMLDAHSTLRDQTIGSLLLCRELYSTRFLRGHDGPYSLEGESLKAQVLQKLTAGWQRIRGAVGNLLVMPLSFNRVAQKEDGEHVIDQEHVFDGVSLLLAAVIELLIIRVLGARDGSLGAIVTKRGPPSCGGELFSEFSRSSCCESA